MLLSELSEVVGINSRCQLHLLNIIKDNVGPDACHLTHSLILVLGNPHDLSIMNLGMKIVEEGATDDYRD